MAGSVLPMYFKAHVFQMPQERGEADRDVAAAGRKPSSGHTSRNAIRPG